jgi:hypothetical protein
VVSKGTQELLEPKCLQDMEYKTLNWKSYVRLTRDEICKIINFVEVSGHNLDS